MTQHLLRVNFDKNKVRTITFASGARSTWSDTRKRNAHTQGEWTARADTGGFLGNLLLSQITGAKVEELKRTRKE
jgi:hypothetical protein